MGMTVEVTYDNQKAFERQLIRLCQLYQVPHHLNGEHAYSYLTIRETCHIPQVWQKVIQDCGFLWTLAWSSKR